MFIQGFDTASMNAWNQSRLNGLNSDRALERISTGLRVNRGADDPSGLAVGTGMAAQLRGIAAAIHNLQDGINLIRTADGGLNEIGNILLRQRDIAVRGANEATLYTITSTNPNDIEPSPTRALFNEFQMLDVEVYDQVQRHKFNTKQVLFGYEFGQPLQAGPDNGANHRIDVVIPDMSIMGTSVPGAVPGTITQAQFTAAFQQAIDLTTDNIKTVADARAQLGVEERRILHAVNDLSQQYINVAAAKSGIMDADIAKEMVELTRTQILDQASPTLIQQSFAERGIIDTMLKSAGLDASQRVKPGTG